jgi:DNA invertase Pin-like site-specific DNA recombinase
MRAALYARFSTDKQRDASIDDQFRECERMAKAIGCTVSTRFEDRGISGGTAQRPGYQAMASAARTHQFDVIISEDISRMWRNRKEYGDRSTEFEDCGVHLVTCVGDDTRRDGWMIVTIKLAMAEQARKEASYRTRRGQEGNARAGKSTGGRAYGYVPVKDGTSGRIEINATEAPIVRRIFEMYASGASARAIAATFNAEGIPSPGAGWKRTKRRTDGKWLASSIHGDIERGTGILNNRRYVGVTLWGRSEWKRSAADSKKRRHIMLEAGAAHESTDERFRIVPQALWDRVKARQTHQSKELGSKVKGALRQRARPVKYLLSGLLRCQACESSFALSNATRYQCSSHHEGGTHACAVTLSVPRDRLERVMLDCAHTELLDPVKLAEIEAWHVAHRPATVDYRPRIAELEAQVANFVKAIGSGTEGIGDLVAALKAARGELDRLKALGSLPRAAQQKAASEPVGKRAARMRERLEAGGELAQAAMRELFPGSIWLEADDTGRFLWAHAQGAWPTVEVIRPGPARAEEFPMIYAVRMGQVDVSGSGGVIQLTPTFRLSLAA